VKCLLIRCRLDSALKLARRPKELPTMRRFPVNDLRILATGSSHAISYLSYPSSRTSAGEGMVSAEFARAKPRSVFRLSTICSAHDWPKTAIWEACANCGGGLLPGSPRREGLGLREEREISVKAELAIRKRASQSGNELATENPAQHFDWKEEGITGFDPARVIGRQSAGRDYTMDVRMMFQFLIPGV